MKKDVFLVITDLHETEKNFSTRIDYKSEIQAVYSRIFGTIEKYKRTDANVHLLFLGDIFHRSYRSPEKSMESMDTVQYLCSCVDTAYSAVGNHEITWASSNPFWYLVTDLENAPSLKSHAKKKLDAKGLISSLKVVDRLEFGDAEFLFNHFGVPVHKPSMGKISIGLFHQDIVVKELFVEMEKKYDLQLFDAGTPTVDDTGVLDGYQYVFAGHQHLSYGTYVYTNDKTKSEAEVYWLASLGRTNEGEVQDSFLERNIPAIIFEDRKFIGVEDNLFELPSRGDCVNEKMVITNKEYRKTVNARKNITMLRFTVDPIENLKKNFDGNAVMQNLIDCYAQGTTCSLEELIHDRYEKVTGVW